MATVILPPRCARCVAAGLVAVAPALARADVLAGNLLANPGFEDDGGGGPAGWHSVALPGGSGRPSFVWSRDAASGERAAEIAIDGSARGLWQQMVPIEAGTVYTISGHVAFVGVTPPGTCRLEVVFRDAGGDVVQMVPLPGHVGTRNYEPDYPYPLQVRAPAGAVVAEVNGFLAGPGRALFDDLFLGPSPLGSIVGTVTSAAAPLAGVKVSVWGDPWGEPAGALTGSDGRYEIAGVPVALPRYIVLAAKEGYCSRSLGRIAVAAGSSTTANFELAPGRDPLDELEVGYGFLEMATPSPKVEVPADAEIPADPLDYPEGVRVYLASDAYITADDPAVVALAAQLLEGVAPEERRNTRAVAWAVYEWIARNITHDAVFGSGREPYRDVTSGIWQTIQEGGWCWGRSFYDWAYRPAELLATRTGICVEHSWLASALLRALGIPARARVGSAQFWVQKPGVYGYWVGISTNDGSNEYRERGFLGAGFGGDGDWSSVPVTSEPFLHEDWNMASPGLWHERHPWSVSFPATAEGLAAAHADMDAFAATGRSGEGERVPPDAARYEIRYSFITLSLLDVGGQRTLDVRFPLVSESASHEDLGRQVVWTNHPECVLRTWVEAITNPAMAETQRWYHVALDLSPLVDVPRIRRRVPPSNR